MTWNILFIPLSSVEAGFFGTYRDRIIMVIIKLIIKVRYIKTVATKRLQRNHNKALLMLR